MIMKNLRGAFRLLFFALAGSWLILKISWFNFWKGENLKRAMRIRQAWTRAFVHAIGVRIQVQGTPPDFPCILMCNHRSYLDPVVLTCQVRAMPVSKAEVAKWPIIGYGGRISGTFFLQRESQTSRKMLLGGMAEKVREGFSIILFPEGTTHDRPETSPLKRGGFQLAANHQIPIVPVALEYSTPKDYWVGSDTFLPHFIQRFGEKHMRVSVRYGAPIRSDDADELLRQTQQWIDAQIPKMRREFF